MKYEQLIAQSNLELAWRRIVTGRNYQYKRFFRPVYLAYEVGRSPNLKRLHDRLRGSWEPTSPVRVYIPKPSGLQRPLTLLSLEDQIVLQGIANCFARKLAGRRSRLSGVTVFSNLLESPSNSAFFIQDWHATYSRFQDKCREHFQNGLRWIAHFDLAAFYDTISHELLVRAVAPRTSNEFTWTMVKAWLKCWSSPDGNDPFHHGIPQGPIASDFLAEALLLPLDEALSQGGMRYVRYVDDIRLFSRSKMDAHKAAVKLEVYCRNLGLIPQGKKFTILEAKTIGDALGSMPSLAPPDSNGGERRTTLLKEEAERLFRDCVARKPHGIIDKSKARYVLYRAPRSRKILGLVLRLLPKYPEHIDAFAAYLSIYTRGRGIERAATSVLTDGTPYDYVRGELWQILAGLGPPVKSGRLARMAQRDVGNREASLSLKLGALIFLLKCEANGSAACAGRIRYQPALVQGLLVPHLPDSAFEGGATVPALLRQKSLEPGIMLAEQFVARQKSHLTYGVRARDMLPEVQNVFRQLRLLRRRADVTVDQIGELLARRYSITPVYSWRRALGPEYTHCLQILLQAEAVFDAGRSQWLQLQNSFNDALTRRLIDLLRANNLPGGVKTVDSSGKLVKFGTLLQLGAPFGANYPSIAGPFRDVNARRNKLPASHPYDEKGGTRNHYLAAREQHRFRTALGAAYTATVTLIDTLV